MTYYRYPNGEVYDLTYTPRDGTRLTAKEGKAARRDYCRRELLKILQPGDTVYCILRHVSQSGMSRRISLYTIQDGKPRNIDSLAADAIGWRRNDYAGGIVVSGCGMDMGWHLVDALSHSLWPDGSATLKQSWL